ncbi:MAG: PilN domain-containing protein [Marinicellaceae bacterium]
MNAIEKLQNEIHTAYEESSISQFVRWWKAELKTFVPQKYHEKMFPKAIEILLSQNNENVDVWCNRGEGFKAYSDSGQQDSSQDQWWHQVQHIINEADGKKVVVKYLMPNEEALVRKIALPMAAKENLDDVIGFELDKYVPFNADQVQVSYKIDNSHEDENKMLLDLAVIPKKCLVDVLSLCDEKSIELDVVDIRKNSESLEPEFVGVNLLPKEKRKAKDYFNLKLNALLLIVFLGLVYFIMYTSVDNKQRKIEALTEINSELQKQARESKLLKKELKTVIVSSKFLKNKKNDHPKVVQILSDVTAKLPDTTYLSKMKVSQEEMELSGLSDNANILIPELDKSGNWFVPRFHRAITIDQQTGKDRFVIKADIKEPTEEEENGQS